MLLRLVCILTLFETANCGLTLFDAVYWNVKPYAFINDEGKVDGIYPMIFQQAKIFCVNKTMLDHYNATDVMSFNISNVKSRREFLRAYKSGYKNTSKVRAGRDVWFPIFLRSTQSIRKIELEKGLMNFDIHKSKSIALIVHRDYISLPEKILRGILSCDQILLLTALLSIFFGLIIWLFEGNSNPVFPKNSIRGIGVGIWWSLVSMTTVGYGDVVPKSVPGRFLATIWVCVGVMVICIITATVTEVVTGTSEINIRTKRVSVLEESFESEKIGHFGVEVVEKATYRDVLQAVRDRETFGAAINADVAAWMIDEIKDDSSPNPLRIVKLLPANLNINIAMSVNIRKEPYLRDIIRCMLRQRTEIYDRSINHFHRHCETESIFIGNFLDLFKTKLVQVLLGGIVLFTIVGIIFNTDLLNSWTTRLPFVNRKEDDGTDKRIKDSEQNDSLTLLQSPFSKAKRSSNNDIAEHEENS